MKRKKSTIGGEVIKAGITTMVAIPLIGASATQVAALPAGTARTLAGTAVGLQGVGLIGVNLKPLKKLKFI